MIAMINGFANCLLQAAKDINFPNRLNINGIVILLVKIGIWDARRITLN